jgi:hypothetical protein
MKINESQLRLAIRKALLINEIGSVAAEDNYGDLNLSGNGVNTIDDKLKALGSNVEWGDDGGAEARKVAWLYLQPFLPKGTILTSAYRDQAQQNTIIRNYAKKKGYKGDNTDVDAMHSFIKDKGMVVARKVWRGHGGKKKTAAFDLSGADLDSIWAAVERANATIPDLVSFAKLKQGKGKSSIIERNNNAVHVHFERKNIKVPFDEEAFKAAVDDNSLSVT